MLTPEIVVPLLVLFFIGTSFFCWQLRKSKWVSESFRIPDGVEIVAGEKGPVFRGPATALFPAVTEFLRQLSHMPVGRRVRVGKFVLCSSNEIPVIPDPLVVVLPPDAWNIVASKFAEVVGGWEESPFYFGDCGYLSHCPEPDVGIELVGTPLEGR